MAVGPPDWPYAVFSYITATFLTFSLSASQEVMAATSWSVRRVIEKPYGFLVGSEIGGSAPCGHWITLLRWITSSEASDCELPIGPTTYWKLPSRTFRATCGCWA